MFMYLRVAAAVNAVSVANPEFNTERIIEKMREAEEKKVNITVFPELCVTGFTCADLFFHKRLLNSAVEGLNKIISESEKLKGVFFVGLPLEIENQLYNCAAAVSGGKVVGITVKTALTEYGDAYEKRWFSASEDLPCEEVSSAEVGICGSEYFIPIGRDLIFDMGGVRFSSEICEDLTAPVPNSTILALGGAEVVFNLAASNEVASKRKARRDVIAAQSARGILAYVCANAGAGESTTDLVYSGHSLIAQGGRVLAETADFVTDEGLVVCDIDLEKIRADRRRVKTFKDTAAMYNAYAQTRIIKTPREAFECDGALHKIKKLAFIPDTKQEREERCMEIFSLQVAGLKKRMSVAGKNLVIGVSGGLDSTLALLVCVEAARQMGLSAKSVTGITLPCFGTSDRTYNNSVELMKKLGITWKEISIKEACSLHCKDIGHKMDDFDVTYENLQARERTQVLMDYACQIGGFVVGTGDLSELALGWCTYNADHMSMYGVNASVPKTLIRWMLEAIADKNIFTDCKDVLSDIIDTPISPELLPPGENGQIAQETESIVGPYALHDFFLYNMMRYGFEPKKIYYMACRAFKDDFGPETVLKWLKMFYRRFFTQQFKRSCVPDGVKAGAIALSPRGDLKMPSDASFAVWMADLEDM